MLASYNFKYALSVILIYGRQRGVPTKYYFSRQKITVNFSIEPTIFAEISVLILLF